MSVLTVNEILPATTSIDIGTKLASTNSTEASETDGALIVDGGLGVEKDIFLGGMIYQNTPEFYVTNSATQSISYNTETTVQFDTIISDTDLAFDNGNDRFDPSTFGRWLLIAQVEFSQVGNGNFGSVSIFDDTNTMVSVASSACDWSGGHSYPHTSVIVNCDGTSGNNYWYVKCFHTYSSGTRYINNTSETTFFKAIYLGL